MAYVTSELKEKAIKAIKEHNLLFIEDICAYIGISVPCFYDHFNKDSNDYKDLRYMLDENKITVKTKIRKKWLDADRDTGLMALYKLCSTPEEHKKLQQNYTDHTTDGEKININPKKWTE